MDPHASFEIVFEGRVRDDFDKDIICRKLTEILEIDLQAASELLLASRRIIAGDLEDIEAEALATKLKDAGLMVEVRRMEKDYAAAPPPPPPPFVPETDETTEEDQADNAQAEDSAFSPAPPPPPPPPADGEPYIVNKATSAKRLSFNGNGGEYFKIWIVNILLSIVTLGLYSPWAKVRRKQYFYGNTILDGASFQYLADPMRILKGRLIVAAVFAIYLASDFIDPIFSLVITVLFIPIAPWVIIKSLAFNARNSSYRNVTFSFKATYKEALPVFVLWPIVASLTLGILWPWVYRKQRAFVASHHSYGDQRFEFYATNNDYYRLFIKFFLLFVVPTVILAFGGLAIPVIPNMAALLWIVFVSGMYTAATSNVFFNNTRSDELRFNSSMDEVKFGGIVATNTLGVMFSAGIFHPWATVRAMKYRLEHLSVSCRHGLDDFAAIQQKQISAVGEEMGDFFDMDFGL